jgi:transposase
MTSPRRRRPKRSQRSVSPFVKVHWYVLDSQGWHDLSLMARCAYVELARRYDGANNGMIGMSARDLGKRLNRSPSHAAKALRELEDAGFITITKQGTFKRKNRLASEYRLNAFISDIDSDLPDRKWKNARWDGVTSNTVRWQNKGLKESKEPSRCHQQRRQALNDPSHSVASDTHIESTRG